MPAPSSVPCLSSGILSLCLLTRSVHMLTPLLAWTEQKRCFCVRRSFFSVRIIPAAIPPFPHLGLWVQVGHLPMSEIMTLLNLHVSESTLEPVAFPHLFLCPLFSQPRPHLTTLSMISSPLISIRFFWARCISTTGLSWPGSTAVSKQKTDICLLVKSRSSLSLALGPGHSQLK